MSGPTSSNFGFLERLDPSFVTLGAQAEQLFTIDPAMCLVRLRLLGEKLARELAANAGLPAYPDESQAQLLVRLRQQNLLAPDVADRFHSLRKTGNAAAHEGKGSAAVALHQMKMVRRMGMAVMQTLSLAPPTTKLPPFVPPAAPADASKELRAELDQLRADAERAAKASAEAAAAKAAAEEAAKLERAMANDFAAEAQKLEEKLRATEALFDEQNQFYEQRLSELVDAIGALPEAEVAAKATTLQEEAQVAGAALERDLTEAETREIIDEQLRAAGWEASSVELRWGAGARPVKNRNLAIAEWPTASGPADYALFLGLSLVGVVEAKRGSKSAFGALDQARRYSETVALDDAHRAGGPWEQYAVPFVYATNGRAYLTQVLEETGIWFHDLRRPTNLPRATMAWPSPEGLARRLAQDVDAAHAKLEAKPIETLKLRYYQEEAIRAVERAIEAGQRTALLAMATGTGKTRTCIGLVYRLLEAARFHRILFVVDRSALGEQAEGAFKDAPVDQLKTFAEIFELKGLDSDGPESSTRLHIATIQSMVRRVLFEDEPPPVDTYDCIVIDESHRGYTLDAEMSDAEMGFRSEADYVSKYRRVLDYFDAVKIGLTATPALHTREIFGDPVYQYSYPEAVIDDYLVDHEPPVRIVTALARDGITWKAGEEVTAYEPSSKTEQLWLLPDDVKIDVEGFNRQVVTENFNRAVCRELVKHIDPDGDEKTLVFCVDDKHCQRFVRILNEAFEEVLGEVNHAAVQRITGAVDKPREMIRRFKNEKRPTVAVTVDLLTTGIDVPAITNLVFMRRVRSRILYEQMLGRATRLCPDIGKEVFRIYDAVDLYGALKSMSEMKPVGTTRTATYTELVDELKGLTDEAARAHVLGELRAKLNRKKGRIQGELAEQFEALAGVSIEHFNATMREMSPADAVAFFEQHDGLAGFLDRKIPTKTRVLVSTHADEVVEVSRGYGKDRQKPEDYLSSFAEFVRTNINQIPALMVVTQRPRDLTRQQLKELKLLLDEQGYDEPSLRTAHKQQTNVEIAASIVGFIRQAALGDPLVPYDQRVQKALARILASRDWNVHQKKWLNRIGEQMKVSTVVDRDALDRRPFAEHGGFKRIDKLFDGRLEEVLGDLGERVWQEGA